MGDIFTKRSHPSCLWIPTNEDHGVVIPWEGNALHPSHFIWLRPVMGHQLALEVATAKWGSLLWQSREGVSY
jgi:hypothetical protein